VEKEPGKITILIAEDDKANYLLIRQIIKNEGYEILHAVNGKEAVDACHNNSSISIVLMDLKMPVLDGYAATRQIKEFRPLLPIIAETAYAMHGEKEKALNAGCDDYITKPFKKQQLLSIIEKMVRGS
jgi:CheY-like chemotaxis protein